MPLFRHTILNYAPLFPWPLILLWLLTGTFLALQSHRHFRGLLGTRQRYLQLGLRLLALLLSTILFLQPQLSSSEPEPDSFRVAVLADLSRSMQTQDSSGQSSRAQILQLLLQSPELAQLHELGQLEFWAFSEQCRPLNPEFNGELPVLPGSTDIGQALQTVATGSLGAADLGAVILCSDGNDSASRSGTQVAKEFARQQIPISCIGIGSRGSQKDLQVRFISKPQKVERDSSFTLSAIVQGNFDETLQLEAELLENGIGIQKKNFSLEARQNKELKFELSSAISGHNTYAIRIPAPPEDQRPDNNLDFISVNITEPESFKLLYLSGALNWEWRFLRIHAENNQQLQLSAIIKSGPHSYFRSGISGKSLEDLKDFPENTIFYADYDAVILDDQGAALLSEAACQALLAFVDGKGGGILFTGDPALLPPPLLELSPVYSAESRLSAPQAKMYPEPDLVFDRQSRLLSRQNRSIALPGASLVWLSQKLKLGARNAMALDPEGKQSLLAVQSYGAGRSAFLGTQETWKWRFDSPQGLGWHNSFWNCLLLWLTEQKQEQLQPEKSVIQAAVDEECQLGLFVLGSDFKPAPDASPMAYITIPSGEVQEISMQPDIDEVGYYRAAFPPQLPGEHRIRWQVKLTGQNLSCESLLLAKQSGKEMQNTDYQEETLRDIARISGGKFYDSKSFLAGKATLPLSPLLPQRQSSRPLASSWTLLLSICAVFTLQWALRRHHGLK
ncbi:MAG: VWA domain-containing protein [Oligosphaeraceae bacterium]|nr:VWA domain-containing protein [Oligosphaeraceae bacterium]